jgi:hypothetical protein
MVSPRQTQKIQPDDNTAFDRFADKSLSARSKKSQVIDPYGCVGRIWTK